MSIYKDLNDIKLDISEFQETQLSHLEQKRILKGFKNKIMPIRQKRRWLLASVSVVALALLSLSLAIDKGTIASMPFVGGVVEKYNYPNIENLDFSSYKTAIGETAENELGKLTLNEVMLDDQQVVLSSTFEPADDVKFDYQTHIRPVVKVNGQDYTITTGSQSIELNDSMFTIYNDIDLNQAIETEDIHIQLSYETLGRSMEDSIRIEKPWTFDVQVSQANLLAAKKVFEMKKPITLNNGEQVTIERVVSTPISTTIYYDLSLASSENIYFTIQSEDGVQQRFSAGFTSLDQQSFGRFNGLTLTENSYYLIAHDSNHNPLSERIPIN